LTSEKNQIDGIWISNPIKLIGFEVSREPIKMGFDLAILIKLCLIISCNVIVVVVVVVVVVAAAAAVVVVVVVVVVE